MMVIMDFTLLMNGFNLLEENAEINSTPGQGTEVMLLLAINCV